MCGVSGHGSALRTFSFGHFVVEPLSSGELLRSESILRLI